MNAVTALQFVAGLVLLAVGAEGLVRGATGLARALGVSALVIALTVVAYGTGAPELAITLQSVSEGRVDLATGNIVGSNIANILLILGIAGVVMPLLVRRDMLRIDLPFMIGLTALLFPLSADGRLSRLDGVVLIVGGVIYTVVLLRARLGRDGDAPTSERPARTARGLLTRVLLVLAGLGLLVLGSRWLVDGATEVARALGLSELVIGLTLVAIGTSLPEIATSLSATFRREPDVAVGNAIGSNIVNIALVLGLGSVIAAEGLPVDPALIRFDMPVMLAAAVACVPIFFTGWRIARWESLLFLFYYAAYLAYLVLDASGHDRLPAFSAVMLGFVIPLSVATLALLVLRAIRRGNHSPEPG